jgi:hypothetical protein
MQRLGVRRPIKVKHGQRPVGFDPNGIDYQRVAFVMPDGIPVPRRRHVRRVRLVHAHLAEFMIPEVKESYLVRLL